MIALYAHLFTALYAHLSLYAVALRGGNTTPSLSLMPFCRV
jgi:hypothetical protein